MTRLKQYLLLSLGGCWLLLASGCRQEVQERFEEIEAYPTAAESVWSGQIVSVGDGDTVEIEQKDDTITVRLACIDAPESSQAPWGEQSRQHLQELLPPGQTVKLRVADTDRYGRTVAEIYRRNQSVNLQMVEDGHAVVYRQYLDSCAETSADYLAAEALAQNKQRGYWNQLSPCMPWDFRRHQCLSS